MGSGTLAEPVLVGREHELEELRSYLDSAVKGRGNTVFVSGEAGAGKTRLVTEFLDKAKTRGVTVLTGWCLSNAAVPYFPFFEAFSHYFTEAMELDPVTGRLQQFDATAYSMESEESGKLGKQVVSPQVWKDQTFAAVASTLSSIASKNPVILFVDDAQWADSASLALIHYLARIVKSEKALVVATFRSEQLTIDAEGRPCSLVETLRLMRREELYKEIKLATLNKEDVSALASNMLGGCEVQPEFAERLAKESQGNPLFVVESLRMLHEREDLVLRQGNWCLARGELQIPDKIMDIILQRLSGLTRNQRKILDAASVIGERFDAQLLASILSIDLSEAVETLDAIGQATSLVGCEGELYKFDHARSRDAVYSEISPALRKVYHTKAAETLEGKRKESDLLSGDLFYHYSQAGNNEKALKYALDAGRDALARWSNVEAIKHFDYVLKSVGEKPERCKERLTALEGLGDAFFASCMFKEAARIFENLADTPETGVPRLRALRKAIKSAMLFGDRSYMKELGRKADKCADNDRVETARILMDRSVFSGEGLDRILEDHIAALRVFEEEYSLSNAASALFMIGVTKTRLGKPQEGLAESLRSISLFEELGDFRSQLEAYFFAGLTFNNCLLRREAFEMFAKIMEIDEKMRMGDYFRLTDANSFSALSLAAQGNFEKALSYALRALELSEKTDSITSRGLVYAVLTMIYTRLEDLVNAEKYFEKLMKLPPEIQNHIFIRATNAKAVLSVGKNQWEESNRNFDEYLEFLKNNPVPAGVVSFKSIYAWALEKQGRFDEAKVQLAEAQKIRREAEAKFEHANVQANMMARRQVVVGDEFEMRVDCVNVGRKQALLVGIKNALLGDFKITSSPPWCIVQEGTIEAKNKEIGAFQVITAKFTLKIMKSGTFTLNPRVIYVDDMGKEEIYTLRPVTVTSNSPAAPEKVIGKISSGTLAFDQLLLGGLPENYAVALAAPSSDERALLIKRFLEAGAEAGQTTFYVSALATNTTAMIKEESSNFYLILCNSQADTMVQNAPNISKLKGVENLTDVDIALTKAFRTLGPSGDAPKRICIDILSDVLLQHHAVTTRKWLSSLLPTLKSKGFSILAIIDPGMHPAEETQAVIGLFDGEISLYEKETHKGPVRFLKIRKMTGQKYSKEELPLTEE